MFNLAMIIHNGFVPKAHGLPGDDVESVLCTGIIRELQVLPPEVGGTGKGVTEKDVRERLIVAVDDQRLILPSRVALS